MFTRIRKKQLSLCQGLIILLLGSWMSYACMPCFACNAGTGVHLNSTMKMSFHPMQHQQGCYQHNTGKQTTGHHCNCHFYVAVAASDPAALLAASTSQGFDLLPALAYMPESRPWQAMTASPGNYLEPERAYSPPFNRYTVLLN